MRQPTLRISSFERRRIRSWSSWNRKGRKKWKEEKKKEKKENGKEEKVRYMRWIHRINFYCSDLSRRRGEKTSIRRRRIPHSSHEGKNGSFEFFWRRESKKRCSGSKDSKRGEKVSASLRSFHLLPSFPWMKKTFLPLFSEFRFYFFISFSTTSFSLLSFFHSPSLSHLKRTFQKPFLEVVHPSLCIPFCTVHLSLSLSWCNSNSQKTNCSTEQNRTQFKLTYAIFELSSSYWFHSWMNSYWYSIPLPFSWCWSLSLSLLETSGFVIILFLFSLSLWSPALSLLSLSLSDTCTIVKCSIQQ